MVIKVIFFPYKLEVLGFRAYFYRDPHAIKSHYSLRTTGRWCKLTKILVDI